MDIQTKLSRKRRREYDWHVQGPGSRTVSVRGAIRAKGRAGGCRPYHGLYHLEVGCKDITFTLNDMRSPSVLSRALKSSDIVEGLSWLLGVWQKAEQGDPLES